MMRKKDEIVQVITECRTFAVKRVIQWLDEIFKDHREPLRSGVPKGDRIGYSRKKFKAAYLMVIYPRGLRLKDIAKLSGTSEAVLRVWRTEKDFKKAVKIGCGLFGKILVRSLESNFNRDDLDESAINDLKFISDALHIFDTRVSEVVIQWMKEKLDSPPSKTDLEHLAKMRLIGLASRAIKISKVYDKKSLREFERNSHIIEMKKTLIGGFIDDLVEPENVKNCTADQLKKYGEGLKEMVFSTINELAF